MKGNQDVKGNQYVSGNQYVYGNQTVRRYQYVRGNQDVRGCQSVKAIKINLYTKWQFLINRDTDIISIGCESKTISEWERFFANKETIELPADDRNYKKLASAFKVAVAMREHLILMNDHE